MIFTFEKIETRGEKKFKCSCGRRVKLAKRFYQTINPFNKHNGILKSREQILIEIHRDRRIWEIVPEFCKHSHTFL